jgi:hypothetical protein
MLSHISAGTCKWHARCTDDTVIESRKVSTHFQMKVISYREQYFDGFWLTGLSITCLHLTPKKKCKHSINGSTTRPV